MRPEIHPPRTAPQARLQADIGQKAYTTRRADSPQATRRALSERADYGTDEGIAPISAPGLSAGRVGDQGQQARSESARRADRAFLLLLAVLALLAGVFHWLPPWGGL